MRELIGLDITAAIAILEERKLAYTVEQNDSDKLKSSDCALVVKAVRVGDTVRLTTSRFRMAIEDITR